MPCHAMPCHAMPYITLHYIALHCITLHYITLHTHAVSKIEKPSMQMRPIIQKLLWQVCWMRLSTACSQPKLKSIDMVTKELCQSSHRPRFFGPGACPRMCFQPQKSRSKTSLLIIVDHWPSLMHDHWSMITDHHGLYGSVAFHIVSLVLPL